MPQLAAGDILLYTIRYTQANQRFMNTQYIEYFDTDSATDDYITWANAFLADLVAPGKLVEQLQDIISSTISIDSHQVQKVYPLRLAPDVSTLSLVGAIGTGPAPLNSAATLTKASINATRWGIGSWHQPGGNVANMANSGNWNTTFVDNIATALNGTFVGLKAVTAMNGKYQGILWGPANPTRKTPILGFNPQYTIRTMHRRTVRVGE